MDVVNSFGYPALQHNLHSRHRFAPDQAVVAISEGFGDEVPVMFPDMSIRGDHIFSIHCDSFINLNCFHELDIFIHNLMDEACVSSVQNQTARRNDPESVCD